jgi:hypothetical protein
MVRVEINPCRVEKVSIEAESEMEHDFDLATFYLIQPHLTRINRELKRLLKRGRRKASASRNRHTSGMRLAV